MQRALHFIETTLLDPATAFGAVFYAVFFFGLALFGMRLVKLWSEKFADHPALFIDRTSARFIAQLLRLGCFLIAATAYAHMIPTLQKVGTALIASASVISVIIGFAAQNTLGNLIAGIALLFYRPFGIGDVLSINTATGKETGTVKEFSLGYTKLLADDGRWIIAPNSVVISSILIRIR